MAPGVDWPDIKWLAVVAAMLVNIALGFVWYAKWFPTGKVWMRAMKIPADMKPTPKQMAQSFLLMIVGTFLLMLVFAHVVVAFRDAYRLDGARMDAAGLTIVDGLQGGFFTWIGFFVPLALSGVAWEGKPWSLFFVNTGYQLVTMLAAGAIFATMV